MTRQQRGIIRISQNVKKLLKLMWRTPVVTPWCTSKCEFPNHSNTFTLCPVLFHRTSWGKVNFIIVCFFLSSISMIKSALLIYVYRIIDRPHSIAKLGDNALGSVCLSISTLTAEPFLRKNNFHSKFRPTDDHY